MFSNCILVFMQLNLFLNFNIRITWKRSEQINKSFSSRHYIRCMEQVKYVGKIVETDNVPFCALASRHIEYAV